MKDVFFKTQISNVKHNLEKSFTDVNIDLIYQDACNILEKELLFVNDRGKKVIGKHIWYNILPGYACYKALLNANINEKTAIDFVEKEMCVAVKSMSNFCRKN